MKETMYQYLLREGLTNREDTKVIFFGQEIKSEELIYHIDKIASFLVSQGVKKGDAVGVCLPNFPHAIIAVYAINKIGAIVNAIHPLLSTVALADIMKSTNTKYLFLMDRKVAEHKPTMDQLDVKIISCSPSDFITGFKGKLVKKFGDAKEVDGVLRYVNCLFSNTVVTVAKDSECPAVYLHSGGTSGSPKTIVLNSTAFNQLSDNIVKTQCADYQYSNDKDSMLMVLPIFHGFGLGVSMHTVLSRGKLVLMPSFDAKKAIKYIKKYHITFLAGIPQMFNKMMNERSFDGPHLSSLKYIFCGGDKLPDDLKIRFDAILKANGSTAEILEGYGLTEATTVVAVNRPGQAKLGSQGQAIIGADVRIIDEDGKEKPHGEIGEIIVTCPSNMLGYLGDEEATERCFLQFEGKRYIHTGDVGYMDADGYLYFKERIKRVIKIMGVNIFPSEIENLVTNLKEIDSACMVASSFNGKPATKLLVVVNPMFKYSPYIEDRIKQYILDNTIKYAVPRTIEVVPNLAKTPVGKVDYKRYE